MASLHFSLFDADYLDIDEINLLFRLYDYKTVKRAWIENVVAQGERYYNLNYFFAWYYFHAKQPRSYVKSDGYTATQQTSGSMNSQTDTDGVGTFRSQAEDEGIDGYAD